MRYKLESLNKEINIPDEEIQNYVKFLKVSEEEAIQIYLEDEGYLVNEEQEALIQKGKENRITAKIHQAKAEGTERKKREVTRKEDPTKEGVIAAIAALLESMDDTAAVKIENVGKIITFSIGEDEFKLDLVKKRKKK